MTSQTSQNSSPFATENDGLNISNSLQTKNIPTVQDEFILRTMHGDLEKLRKNSTPKEKEVLPKIKPVINTVPTVPIQNNANKTASEIKEATPHIAQKMTPVDTPSVVPITNQKLAPAKDIVEVTPTTPSTAGSSTSNSATKIIFTVIIILIICILSLGGYYFYLTNKNKQTVKPVATNTVTTPVQEPQQPQEQPQEPIQEPIVPKYLADKPNYLTLDLANQDASEIKDKLLSIGDDISSIDTTATPYEFTVVDINNNPVAFPIFATAAKLNLSQNILNSLGTDFSLFYFKDGDNVRLAFSANIKNKDGLMKELIKQENTFSVDASLLFLKAAPNVIKGTFASSTYENYSIRYLNLNTTKDLSIDYTTTDSQLVVATSKNTLRAVLDKESQSVIAPKNSSSAETNISNTIPTKTQPNSLQPADNTPSPTPIQ